MNRFRITPSIIPNLFTLMNMFCGLLSIINASTGNYIFAAWLIIIGAIFDALDGFMARLTKSSSELGVELDSLSDVVTFGAAPAFLIYSIQLHEIGSFGILISSLLMLCGGYRLARFNVELVGFDKDFFKGLPIPGSGITIATFVLAYYEIGIGFPPPFDAFVIPLVLLLSYLMISRIKYDTMPRFSLRGIKEKPFHFIFLLTAVVALFFTAGRALFFIFLLMILFGIFRHFFLLLRRTKNKQTS
jgi:CDP-diacylglycerol---serine O-phosphatidyltransferase